MAVVLVAFVGVVLTSGDHAHAWPVRGGVPVGLRAHRRSLGPSREWAPWHVTAGTRHFRVVAFDGHVHSAFSHDAAHPIDEVLWLAERVDLDLVVTTDHGSLHARRFLPRYDGPVHVLAGEEIGGPFGHAVAWDLRVHGGLGGAADRGLESLAGAVHAQGGTLVLAHPGWWIDGNRHDPRRWMSAEALRRGGIAGSVDALELWNQVYWRPSRVLIDEWVGLLEERVYVPIVGNSDFHRVWGQRLGEPRNALLCGADATGALTQTPSRCLREAVRTGRSYVTDGPSLDLRVEEHVPGEIVEVEPGASLEVVVRALAPEGGTLALFLGRRVVREIRLGAGEESRERVVLRAPAEDSYVRVEIQRLESRDDRPPFSLVSNPVRIDVLPRREDGWRRARE